MGEATGLFFSLILALVPFIGSGAYAVLGIADYRAARRGFWVTAISFATMGLLLGIMTTWPLPVRIAISAIFCAVAAGGLIWVLDYLKVREQIGITEPIPNFVYVATLPEAGNPLGAHVAFIQPNEPKAVLNVNISVQPTDDATKVIRFSAPIIYQEGLPLVPPGQNTALQLPAGDYFVYIQTQGGTFIEQLSLQERDGMLKRKILVYKALPRGEGGIMSPILQIID